MNVQQLYNIITDQKLTVSTDSRTAAAGTIYFGLRGDVFDGNQYAADALKNGADFAVIDNPEFHDVTNDRMILVNDTYSMLQEIAHLYRTEFSIPILVIAGSNGKTTTKELVAAVLSKKYRVHTTTGNLNNHVGVPLTLLSMPHDTEIAVIEIGANHANEHTMLMNCVAPTHALVTNNGADHLEGFGSLAGVRSANREVYDWIAAHTGTVFVNREITNLMEDSDGLHRIVYPVGDYSSSSDMYAGISYNEMIIKTQLVGSLNELNILAAVAVGEQFDVPMSAIVSACADYTPKLKRSQLIQQGTTNIILDCYNANPSSMELSLRDFFKTTIGKQRITIVGDMRELGKTENELHREMLDLIKNNVQETDTVIIVGPVFWQFRSEYPFHFFQTSLDAQEYFQSLNLENTYVFLKASRGTKLETVIEKTITI
jgi:UDP-N-acetylmuramoyl-tripeptide--D-alanyl-D-alanine ligase